MNPEENNGRRDFLKKCGLSSIPFLIPALSADAKSEIQDRINNTSANRTPVNFVTDGLIFSPLEYIEKLKEINKSKAIEHDIYGQGGDTASLEKEFAKLTGKEKAIYLPTGTMANQLAIKLLSASNTKVLVPENSHIYRDEADAAQSVHNKRLIPLGKGKPYFDLPDLKQAIEYLDKSEVFKSGLGTVAIENPVRRADGKFVPIETIRQISAYCRQNGIRLHLDGARIHIASAFSNISVNEYASYFDTIYISLYKYLNANGGAILCGDSAIIDQVPHQIKIHGGTIYQNWSNTSMALHYLNGIDDRFRNVVAVTRQLISELNKIEGISITNLENGTNIYDLKLAPEINSEKFTAYCFKEHNIMLRRPDKKGIVKFFVNESLLSRGPGEIPDALRNGAEKARG